MRAGAFSHCTFYRRSDLTFHVPAFQGNHIEWLAPFSLERSRAQLRCPRLPPAVLVTPLRCVPQRGPRCSRTILSLLMEWLHTKWLQLELFILHFNFNFI